MEEEKKQETKMGNAVFYCYGRILSFKLLVAPRIQMVKNSYSALLRSRIFLSLRYPDKVKKDVQLLLSLQRFRRYGSGASCRLWYRGFKVLEYSLYVRTYDGIGFSDSGTFSRSISEAFYVIYQGYEQTLRRIFLILPCIRSYN